MSNKAKSAAAIAEAYYDGWRKKSADDIAAICADDVRFSAPAGTTVGRAAFREACSRMFPVLKDIRMKKQISDDASVFSFYDFLCADPIGSCRTAELLTIREGRIQEVELFFDPRQFAPRS